MDLRLSDEQMLLQQSVRRFVEHEAPPDQVTGWFRDGTTFRGDLFQKAARAGWLGMLLPREVGGASAEAWDCAVVFEQLGRGPVPGPFFASGVLCPLLLWEASSSEQRNRLIPPLCNGEVVCTAAVCDDMHGWDPGVVSVTARVDGDDFILDGRKHFVHDAKDATHALCTARGPEGLILVLVGLNQEGVAVQNHRGFLTSLGELEFAGVRVPKDEVLSGDADVRRAIDTAVLRAIPILSAFQVGACQSVFEMTVEYTNDRMLYGQPIGRLQRVQDHCVELVNHLDAARWITYETLWKIDSGRPAVAAVHEAKAVATESYYQACNAAHKVFAGPGTALDHPLVPHTLTSRTLYQFLGDPNYHKEQMMRALVDVQLPVHTGSHQPAP
jgi:alkylation response protein AidB-like acyl-CoA dehydrogenase